MIGYGKIARTNSPVSRPTHNASLFMVSEILSRLRKRKEAVNVYRETGRERKRQICVQTTRGCFLSQIRKWCSNANVWLEFVR